MKHSWSRQSGSKVITQSVNETEAYFKKELTEAMDQRHSLTMRKGKRFRSAFTTDQVNYLEKEFKKFPYIGTAHRKEVANALNIHERAVKIWFQNRRMKEKKDAGSKDQESDDQINRKNVGFVNDKLKNVIAMPSLNDPCYSLPQLNGVAQNTLSDINTNNYVAKIEPSAVKVSEPLKLNYYNDISPVRDTGIPKVTYPDYAPPPVANNPQFNYRSSAEFSIDLCKKYRNNFVMPDEKTVENKSPTIPAADTYAHKVENNNVVRTTPPFVYHRDDFAKQQNFTKIEHQNLPKIEHQGLPKIEQQILPNIEHQSFPKIEHQTLPKLEHQSLPEDLSFKPNINNHREPSPAKTMDGSSPGYIPFYVNYPQPYLSAGNMLWKPVNVLPIMSTGVSAVNISSNQSGSLSVSQEQSLPRRKCNCDCHLELPTSPLLPLPENGHNAQAQYVITALPFQNYPKY